MGGIIKIENDVKIEKIYREGIIKENMGIYNGIWIEDVKVNVEEQVKKEAVLLHIAD